MNKIMNEYWIVIENKTGKIIANCGDINDAMMMVSFDPHNRNYSRCRFLQDQVIDVASTTDKQLPGQIGLPESPMNKLTSYNLELPESQEVPFIV